jgi:hypothetical protein
MQFKERVPFRGTAFEHGDDHYVVPALPLGVVREYQERVSEIKIDTENSDWVRKRQDVMIEFIVLALRKNYSEEEATEKELQELVTIQNLGELYRAAAGEVEDGGGKPLGVKSKVKSLGEINALDQNASAGARSMGA